MARKAFSIHSDYYTELLNLKPEHRGELLSALIAWATDAPLPEIDSALSILFRLMTAQIERISEANRKNREGKTKTTE